MYYITMCKKKRYMELAKRMAEQSEYGKFKHGAVLVQGGSVLNCSFNKDNYNSFGSRFRPKSKGNATLHAEIGCVLGIPRTKTTGADVYVLIRLGTPGCFGLSMYPGTVIVIVCFMTLSSSE